MSLFSTRNTLLGVAFLLAATVLLPVASAQVNPMSTRTLPSDYPNADDASNPAIAKDNAFLRRAADAGMGEIQLSQLAVTKASSDDVKNFAQKMVEDHTYLAAQLKPFDDAAHIPPPKKLAKADQKELDKLNGLSGADFDKEYLAYMDKVHHRDLNDFRTEQNYTSNSSLKGAVTKGGDLIQGHTEIVDKLSAAH